MTSSYECFNHVQDAEDLSFKKGDILVVVEQNEEKWWTAMDEQGNKGLIPEPYVKKVCTTVTCSAILCGRNLSWKFLTDPISWRQNISEYFMCAIQSQFTSQPYCSAWNHYVFQAIVDKVLELRKQLEAQYDVKLFS